jgi:hypothetical protein
MLVRSYGLFWRNEEIEWKPGPATAGGCSDEAAGTTRDSG